MTPIRLLMISLLLTTGERTLLAQSDQTTRYHEMLLKRPQPGLVWDRFIGAWLESGSSESLAAFLKNRHETAADFLVLALFHEYEGDEADALKAYESALAKDPANASAWVQRAKLEARTLAFDAALKSLDQTSVLKPTDELVLEIGKLRGRLFLRTGRTAEALKSWQDLLATQPADEDLAEEVIELELDEALFEEAAVLTRSLIEKTKDTSVKVTRRLLLGDILIRGGKQADAMAVYSEALSQSGQDTWVEREVLAQIETAFRRGGDLAGLVTHLEALQKEHPQRLGLQQQSARILAETGAGDKALTVYQDLLQRTPGQRELREAYLDLLTQQEKYKDALTQTGLLQKQNPTDGELHLRLASLHQKLRDIPATQKALAAYLAMPNTGEYEHLRVARMLENWELKPETKTAYETLVKTFPESLTARDAQAHYLHRSGERESALALWIELGKTGDLDQLLAVAQALTTRLEPDTARTVLQNHLAKFGKNDRYLAALIGATLASRESDAKEGDDPIKLRMARLEKTVPLAMERVRLTLDVTQIEDPIRQAITVLTQAAAIADTISKLRTQPGLSIQERVLFAALLETQGDRDLAEQTLREASPKDLPAAQSRLVRLLEQRQDWPRAAAEAEKMIQLPEGRTSQNLQRVVDLHSRSGRPEKALLWLADWKVLSPTASQPWMQEAQLLSLSGKTEESIQVLRTATRKFEDEEAVGSALASALAFHGQSPEAQRIYSRFYDKAESGEDKKRWITAMAQAAFSTGELGRVIERFQERQRANRQDAQPWLALAEIHRIGQNEAERRQALTEAARLQPRDVGLLQQVALAEEQAGQWQDAMRTLEKATALDTSPRSRQQMAALHLTYGDENTGYRMLFDLAGGTQMPSKDALRMADAMATRGDWPRLLEFIEPLCKSNPEDYRLAYIRAVAMEEDGQISQAGQAFIDLLKIQKELPEVLKQKAAAPPVTPSIYLRMQKEAETDLPPGVSQLTSLLESGTYQAYYHQYVRRYNMRSGTSNIIMQPGSIEAVKSMLAMHLIMIGNTLEASQADALWKNAGTAGLPSVAQLRHMQIDLNQLNLKIADGALEKSGWDPVLLAYQTFSSSFERIEPEVAKRAFQTFGSQYPDMALQIATATLSNDAELGRAWLDQALTAYEKKPQLSLKAIYPFSRLLGGGQRVNAQGTSFDITETQKQRLRKLMLTAVQQAPKDTSRFMPFAFAANSMRGSGGWQELVDFIEAEVQMFPAGEARKNQSLTMIANPNRGNAGGLLKALPFPPAITLPPHVALWFRQKDIFNPNLDEDSLPEADFEAVKPLLDGVKNPVLRIALAYKADDMARVDKEIKARVESPEATQEDYLMAASLAQKKEKHMEAAQWLIKAQNPPLETSLRDAADAALVRSVSLIGKPDSGLTQAGIQALRRLRSGRVTPQHRDELIDAMAALGLKEEAEQWKRIAVLTPAPGTQRSVSYSSSSSTTKLQALVSKGNSEPAMREAIKQLQILLTSNFFSGNSSYAKSETKRIIGYLKDKDARKNLIEKLNPGDTAPLPKRREYAGLLEMLDDAPAAQAIYASLLEQNAKDEQSRVRLMTLIAPKDANKAAELIKEVPVKSLAQGFGQELMNVLNNSWDMERSVRLGLAEAIALRLEESSAADAGKDTLDWAVSLPTTLSCTSRNGPNPLPYIHGRYPEQNDSVSNLDSPEAKRLIQVHQRVCLAMMKHPNLAEAGFSWYACTRLAETANLPEVHQDLSTRAKAILTAAAALSRPPTLASPRFNSYQEISARWHPGPVEFLMWQARKEGRPEAIDQEILPLAIKARVAADVSNYKLQQQLWSTPPGEFTRLATKYAVSQPSFSRSYMTQQQNLIWLVDCCAERRLPVAIMDEAILATVKSVSVEYSNFYYLPPFLETRARLAPEAPVDSFLAKWLPSILGPETGWKKRMDTWVQSWYGGGTNRSMNDKAAYNLGQTTQSLLRQPGFLSTGLKLAGMLGLLENDTWMQSNVYNINTQATHNSADALAFLEVINALSDAPHFMTLKSTRSRAHPLTQFTKDLRGKPDIMKNVRAELTKRQPRTFGLDIVEALLSENAAGNLSTVLKKRSTDLTQIPQDRVASVSILLKDNIPALKTRDTADPDLIKALIPILSADNAAQMVQAEKILKASTLTELGVTDTNFEDDVPRLMRDLVNQDRGKAKELFLKGAKLIETKTNASGWSGDTWTQGWTYRSELVDDFNDLAPGLPALALVLQLCHEDDTGMLILDGKSDEGLWGQTLADAWKKAGGAARPGAATDELLSILHKELGQTPPALLALGFYELFVKLPAGVRIPVLQAALKNDSGPTQDLRAELAAAGRFFLSADNASLGNEGLQKTLNELGGLPSAWDHYRKVILNAKLNAQVRIAIAAHLCRKSIHRADPEIIRAAMKIIASENRAFHAVSGDFHYSPVARAFCQLPLDEAWKTEATEQWEVWVARNARNQENANRNRAYKPMDRAACAVLGILARLGDEEAITRVLTDSQDSLTKDPNAFIALVSNGGHAAALRWLEKHWETFLYKPYEGIEFTHQLAEHLPRFIAASAEKPALSLLGELICTTLSDPPKVAQWPGFVGSGKRVVDLVPRLKSTAFPDEAVRTRCLEHTADVLETYPLLQAEYANVAAKADVKEILEMGDTWKTFRRMKPIAASMAIQLWDTGDSTDLVAMLEKMAAIPAADSNWDEVRAYTFSYLSAPVVDYLEWRWGRGDPCDLPKVIAYADKVIACAPRHSQCYALGTHVLLKQMLHIATGDAAAYAAWQKGLPPEDAKAVEPMVIKRNTFFVCAGFFGKPKSRRPLDERLNILVQMLGDPWVQAKYPASGQGVPNLVNLILNTHKLLTLEELPASTAEMARVLPRKGRTAAEAADILAQNARPEGLALYDLAMAETGTDLGLKSNYFFRKTDLLERLERQDEARQLLTEFAKEPRLGAGPKRTLEAALKRLK